MSETKITEKTLVPIGIVWKAVGVLVALVPVIGWAFTVQVKLDYTTKAVEDIPRIREDVAVIKATLAPQSTATPHPGRTEAEPGDRQTLTASAGATEPNP